MNRFILTNNPKVLASSPAARWIDGGPDKVLLECRRMVHEFYPLLTHPLMGDIRLIRNPFRTVLFGGKRREVDLTSLIFIEESINRLQLHFEEDQRVEHQEDYQIIDFDLFQTAIKWSPTESPWDHFDAPVGRHLPSRVGTRPSQNGAFIYVQGRTSAPECLSAVSRRLGTKAWRSAAGTDGIIRTDMESFDD